jgi:glycosyltransferase involved in cell wall biosynthesis
MAHLALIATDSWYLWNFRAATICRLIDEGHDVLVYCGNRAYLKKLEALGARVLYIPLHGRGVRPLVEAGNLLRLGVNLWRDRPDVVLSFNPKGNLYSGFMRYIFSFAWIANVSGLGVLGEAQGYSGRAVDALFRFAFHRVDHVFFQNDTDLKSWTVSKIVPLTRASRQYGSGVDLSEFAFVPAPDCKLEVVCIARLLEKKGIGEFIELAKWVRTISPEVSFCLAGALVPIEQGGYPAEKIEAAVNAGHIRFLGMLDDVRPVLAGRTVGCLLTRYKEGLPRSMIEFLATGRPILVSAFNGAIDLVPASDNGKIVDPSSAGWIVEAAEFILEIARKPGHYDALCGNSRSLAERRFDGNVVIKEYVSNINALL